MKRGLGTQLRHLIDLLDGAVADAYKQDGLTYRPRYTPIMRALMVHHPLTVTQIADTARITQPAATQTIALMVRDGLLSAAPSGDDSRQKMIGMTAYGRELLPQLQACWNATTAAANGLDAGLPFPLSRLLDLAIDELAKEPFAARIQTARLAKTKDRSARKTKDEREERCSNSEVA